MEEKCFSALSHDNRKRTGPLTINKLTHTHKCSPSLALTRMHTTTRTFTHLLSPFPALLFSINLLSLSLLSQYLFIFTLLLLQSLCSPLFYTYSHPLIFSVLPLLCYLMFLLLSVSSPLLSTRMWCRHICMDWDDCNLLRTLCVVKLNLLWADFLWHLKSVLFWGEPASFLAEWRPPPSDQSRV